MRLPDFSKDIDLGPGESFTGVWENVDQDDCVPSPGRCLPESGVIPDGLGSTNDCGTGSREPSPGYEGVLSGRNAWCAIRNGHEVPPYQNGTQLQLRDCDDDI